MRKVILAEVTGFIGHYFENKLGELCSGVQIIS